MIFTPMKNINRETKAKEIHTKVLMYNIPLIVYLTSVIYDGISNRIHKQKRKKNCVVRGTNLRRYKIIKENPSTENPLPLRDILILQIKY